MSDAGATLAEADAAPPTGFGVAAGAMARIMTGGSNGHGNPFGKGSKRERLFESMHQIPIGAIQVPITAGAGAFQMNDLLSPKAGFMWSIRRLTATLFTAGTVQVYKNGFVVGGAGVGGELVAPFATAGTSTFGRGEILLDQNDYLVIIAAGITGSVQIQGAADCIERWLLPDYLM